jgi:hypothetical protein
MYASASSLQQGTTSFGIHKCDVPISILPSASTSSSNPNLSSVQLDSAPRVKHPTVIADCSTITTGRTTTFDVHPAPVNQSVRENEYEVGRLSFWLLCYFFLY